MAQRAPNQTAAMPRNEKNPTRSVTVVTNAPEATAGSALTQFRARGKKDAPERGSDEIDDHSQTDDYAKIGDLEPGIGDDAHDGGECEAIENADQKLAADDAEDVARAKLSGCDGANHDGHGLCGGVASQGGNDRHQHGERYHLLELPLEQTNDSRGEDGSEEIDQQPAETRARDHPDAVGQLLTAAHTAQRHQILVRLLRDDIHDVINGDHTDKPTVRVGDRRGN
jgi:hypothetical protein